MLSRCAASTLALPLLVFLGACGSSPPPVAATGPVKPAAIVPTEGPVDTSRVPEPPGLVVIGRINKPDALVGAASSWTKLPLPSGSELLRSVADDGVADVVDLSQPVDAAISVGLTRHGVDPLFAFAVAVASFDKAKMKLGEQHRLVPGPNGQYKVSGIGKRKAPARVGPRESQTEDEDDDDAMGCVLAHAASGARLVCGEGGALEALVPYLTRTMPREKWSSDVHIEIRPEPVRAPLTELRSSLPILGRSLMGSSSAAVREFVDASAGEVVDLVNDAQKIAIDAQIADSGVVATTRFEFQSSKSVVARMLTAADRADAPPAAFWHLPGDTDTAFFGRGSDPKLFDRPRELVANLLLEATDSAGMPEAERKLVKDLVAERTLALFTNGIGIYAKGFDSAAVDKALKAQNAVKPDDAVGRAEAKRALGEQVIGWHLYQVSEPIAKVGPILKDASSLWNRPGFAKWVKAKAADGAVPKMRIAPLPAAVVLPKDAVHLEISVPRDELLEPPVAPPPPPRGRTVTPALPPKAAPKKVALKPVVLHLFAVPDGGATWLAMGMDAKLVAQKAAASLAAAPEAGTFGKGAGLEALREGKVNGGGIGTLRGVIVFAALDGRGDRSPFNLLGALPGKGAVPIVFTGRAEPPSASAKAGVATGSMRVSRPVIEDIVKLVMGSMH